MLNPAALLKMKGAVQAFTANHPKVTQFFRQELGKGMEAGTIIEISMTRPGQEAVVTNLKISESDLELFKELKNLV